MTADSAGGGVQLALMSNRLDGIVRKMANTLLRTGRSGVLAMARDFSCCIVTAEDELLAAAESLPIHVLSGPDLMAKSMKEVHPNFQRGDAFLHNSPYHGCSHPADHTILVPVIDDDGVHRFTVQAKAHQADIGNSIPTTYFGGARDVYEEGALIFPAVQVQRDYENIEDIIRMCRLRIRVPEQWWGDYLAMIGAARIGEREILALGQEIGWDALETFVRDWFDYGERRMDQAIREIPSGTAEHESTHDAFPGTPEDGIPIRSVVTVDRDAGRVAVDLRDNPDCLPCGLNLSEACARTAAMVGVFNSIDHTVPKNAGAFRRLDIELREGCIVGIPKHPTSCSVATTNIADRVANGVQAAMAQLADGVGMAECGAISPPGTGVVSGIDTRTDRPFVNQIFLGKTCAAAAATADTEGAGRFCGSRTFHVTYGPRGGSMDVIYNSDGNVNGPKGVRGGGGGAKAHQHKLDSDGRQIDVPNCGRVTLADGEMIVSYSCGGGGYGSPLERDPEIVARDVAEGFVSVERAREVYGVVIDEAGSVVYPDTEALRATVT